jgi:hypothetical protein
MRVVATTSGSGATLSMSVPDDPLLLGGAIGVEVAIHDDSSGPLAVRPPDAGLQDDAGQDLPLRGFLPGNWPGSYPQPRDLQILPGQRVDVILNVQLPDAGSLKGHPVHLVGRTRTKPGAQADSGGSGAALVAASPALALVPPTPAQQLNTQLYPREGGWCLLALTANGSRPASPLTAEIWASVSHGTNSTETGWTLEGGNQGVWVGIWPEVLRSGGPIHVEIWVAGSGYVTAQLDQTMPGDGPMEAKR